MGEADRRAAILQLTCLVRPVRERAARLLQTRLREYERGSMAQQRVYSLVCPPENSSNLSQQQPVPKNGGATRINGGDTTVGRIRYGLNSLATNDRYSDTALQMDSAIGMQAQLGQGVRGDERGGAQGGGMATKSESEPW